LLSEPGPAVPLTLERVALIRAREPRAAFLAQADVEAELNRPARDGLIEVGNPKTGVMDEPH
jgi:hypothetical protein